MLVNLVWNIKKKLNMKQKQLKFYLKILLKEFNYPWN